MNMTTPAAAQQSLKALVGLAEVAASAAVDNQLKDKLIKVQQGILDAQSKLGDAVEERLALLHENAALKERVKVAEAAGAALADYVLHAPGDGKFVYKARDW